MRVFVGGSTHQGRVRKNNEDYFGWAGVADTARGVFIGAVADGVGGAEAGEEASRAGVETLLSTFAAAPDGSIPARLTRAIAAANAAVHVGALVDQRATTLVVAAIDGGRMHVANVGDSRLYLLRDGVIRQVSLDHNWVEEQVRSGALTREAAHGHRYRNVITRWLGGEAAQPDLFDLALRSDDRIVLCSDGLTRHVADATIAEVVGRRPEQAAAEELVRLAVAGGGSDNVTVVVVRVTGEGGRDAALDDTLDGTLDVARDATIDATIDQAVPPRPGRDPAHGAQRDARPRSAARPRARRSPGRALLLLVATLVLLVGLGGGTWVLVSSLDGALRLPGEPVAIAAAGDGTLFVATRGPGEVRVYSGEEISAPAARLLGQRPAAVARWTAGEDGTPPTELTALTVAPDGRVLVVDGGAGRVRTFAADGQLLDAWGSPGPDVGQLDQPTAIAVAPDGRVYLVDAGGRRIQAFDAVGRPLAVPWTPATPPIEPVAIAVDAAGRLYVVDATRGEVLRFSPDGPDVERWPAGDDSDGARLGGLAIAADGRVWVADAGRGVVALDADGRPVGTRSASAVAASAPRAPDSLALGPGGHIFVLDRATGDLGVLAPRGVPRAVRDLIAPPISGSATPVGLPRAAP